MSSFQDGITNLLMEAEELRRKLDTLADVSTEDCFQILHDVEELMARLYSPELTVELHGNGEYEIEGELRKHCVQKTTNVAMQALRLAVMKKESDPEDEDYRAEEEKDCQSATARVAELNLVLCCDGDIDGKQETTKKNVDEILDVYASYQRQVLRQRAKPSIARLVDYRKRQKQMAGINANINDESEEGIQTLSKQHIQVLTTILGQATTLIHPLMMWRSNLPPFSALFQLCNRSIRTLDEQAQSLTKTVANWFMEDSQIDEFWMVQMNMSENHEDYTSSNHMTDIDLSGLDTVVDRLAFCCQIFDRYIELVIRENENYVKDEKRMTILQEMHPEWTWKYTSLERFLTTKQLLSALNPTNNIPIEIIVGASVQVPSMVEDAQYLSTRALKRAASTRSDQAIGTVAHSLASDVWTTDIGGSGIHMALVEQSGCYNPRADELSSGKRNANVNGAIDSSPKSSSNSNSFAQALLGALDEDRIPSLSSAPTKTIGKSPDSGTGGLLGTFSSSLASSVTGGDKFLQIRLNTHLCALNGIHSASVACSSLVDFLDSLLSSDDDDDIDAEQEQRQQHAAKSGGNNSMVHLAREELFRYSKSYQDMLQSQAVRLISEFCGNLQDAPVYKGSNVVPVLRYYLERESFDLPDAQHLSISEEDTRLYKLFIHPMNDCKLLQQFEKCDVGVLGSLCEELAHVLTELFLDVLLSTDNPKRFTDWGSLLVSKEVRLVQNHLQALMERAVSVAAVSHQDQAGAVPVLSSHWERLSQAVTILQLEKPSDWSAFYQATSVFSPQELQAILSLRVDFQRDAIERVVASAVD
mmetsp:Transcript_65540/g.133312  ORF Transcript_65540/g.133312 Transcript_65540/m.133312 type:complete len:814 (-) Transcript_65540:1071-3512(-)